MFLIILLIYFIILIFLECIFIALARNKNKSTELFSIIENNKIDKDVNNEINEELYEEIKKDMRLETSSTDIDIKNYIGKLYIENYYGFFINLDTWNLIQSNKIYQFNVPVNIIILKLKEKSDIRYYINK